MLVTIREQYQQQEQEALSPTATFSTQATRDKPEELCPIRTPFQRDRDRILHSDSFRRLMHKTQVFLLPSGDHYRTRLTHTLEVTQIARTIARALRLNEDLTEAIALGHDLGHTPFGHTGEDVLNALYPSGFRHNEQSLRVVEQLEKDGAGLNLTAQVRDGILCHSGKQRPSTPEGQIVHLADRIAYINHDIDDAIRAGILSEEDVPYTARHQLGRSKSQRITTLVSSIVTNGSSGNGIGLREEHEREFARLRDFMFDAVYYNPVVKREETRAIHVVEQLYEYFIRNPEDISEGYHYIWKSEGIHRAVCDYISGMTDRYCIALYEEHFIPKSWGIS